MISFRIFIYHTINITLKENKKNHLINELITRDLKYVSDVYNLLSCKNCL
jgi:hypothetical protein